jgi:hypothetical protein
MSIVDREYADLESKVDQYLHRIEQIDRILAGPLRTLIDEAETGLNGAEHGLPMLRQWLSAIDPVDSHSSRVATSLCVVTLQRFNNVRRRFPELEKDLERLSAFVRQLSQRYVPERGRKVGADDSYFEACCAMVDSKVHGILNPFTGAQVFRVLMETGEDRAHSGPGCSSFFAMVWPLFRRNPDNPLDLGARIEPAQPSAYVTAKCILPLIQLRQICEQRAKLTIAIHGNIKGMAEALAAETWAVPSADGGGAGQRTSSTTRKRWRFCSLLSDLIKNLGELAPISIGAPFLSSVAKRLDKRVSRIRPDENLEALHRWTVEHLYEGVLSIGERNQGLVADAGVVLDRLKERVVAPLLKGELPPAPAGSRWGFEPDEGTLSVDYITMQGVAAGTAAELCDKILRALRHIRELPPLEGNEPLPVIQLRLLHALRMLAAVNTCVARHIYGPVELQAKWCHGVTNREIAFTSADNDTDFDPAELVSSIAVAVRTNRFTTPVQLSDAVGKAVLGAQRDGSWRLLHPFYSGDGSQAIRPPAADVVWTLASALSHFPGIDVADETLFRFVDWLERTQREIRSPGDPPRGAKARTYVGWSSDQMREDHRISLITTSYAANALLAIRDLVEHRLWELCTRRFTVITSALPLSEMDPVDLLVPHSGRLHRLLARMSWQTRTDAPRTPYSLVLHGPPGSSKTAVAGALASTLWTTSWHWARDREATRLIRITPADFTRRGEAHVESEAQLIFRLLGRVRSVTVLFDEIDDLLRRREDGRPRFLDLVIPAMLNRLQDLRDVCPRQEMCFLFGTNYVERIEPALMRRGRIDKVLPVAYPDYESRLATAERILAPFSFKGLDRLNGDIRMRLKGMRLGWGEYVAARTPGWPWSAVTAVLKQVKDEVWAPMVRKHKENPNGAPDFDKLQRRFLRVVRDSLEENNPESQISDDYLERLKRRPHSSELRREVLYSIISRSNHSSLEDVRAELEDRVKEFLHSLAAARHAGGEGREASNGAEPALLSATEFRKLRLRWDAAIAGLPHFKVRVPGTVPRA